MEILIFWKYCELAMRIAYAAPGRERVPARGLLRSYLKVERAGRIPAREIAAKLGGEKRASVFCVGAVRAGLLCRLRWGVYAAPSREAVALGILFPPYYARLISVDSALARAKIRHAFACLAALDSGADFVPAAPLPVVRLADLEAVRGAGVFGVGSFSSKPVTLRTDSGGATFKVPCADPWSAVRVLAAVGLPREAAAARHILRGMRPTRGQAAQLNSLGLSTRSDVLSSADPMVRSPAAVETAKRALAEMARRTLQSGGG